MQELTKKKWSPNLMDNHDLIEQNMANDKSNLQHE